MWYGGRVRDIGRRRWVQLGFQADWLGSRGVLMDFRNFPYDL